jgi:GT2 family glycosyltransferase
LKSVLKKIYYVFKREVFDEGEGFDPQFVIAHADIDF